MHVSIRPLTRLHITAIFDARRKSRARSLACARQYGLTRMVEWFDSGRAGKIHAHHDRHLAGLLSMSPAERLRDALTFWIRVEEADREQDDYHPPYKMLPWLLLADAHLKAGHLDLAFLKLHAMVAKLGDAIVPDSLNPASDEYADVEITASLSA